MKRLWIVWIFFLLAGCRESSRPNSPGQLKIAASIFPVQDVVQQIAGDRASVFHLVPYGANPHTYEPPPSIVRDLAGVDLFVGVHPEFDGWVTRYLPPKAEMLYLCPHDADSSKHETEHDHTMNPHFWLSVRRVREVVPILAERLCALDPESRESCHANTRVFLDRLDTLDIRIRALFSDVPHRKFIQWHPSWDDFSEDYGLEIIGTIERGHGDEPSVRSFGGLIEKARSEDVRVVVVDLKVESRAAEALVREIGGTMLRLDAIGSPDVPERSDYFRLMKDNADKLAGALASHSD